MKFTQLDNGNIMAMRESDDWLMGVWFPTRKMGTIRLIPNGMARTEDFNASHHDENEMTKEDIKAAAAYFVVATWCDADLWTRTDEVHSQGPSIEQVLEYGRTISVFETRIDNSLAVV